MRRQDILITDCAFERARLNQRATYPSHTQQTSIKAQVQPALLEGVGEGCLLADEKYVDGAKIEIIEEGKCGQSIISGMLACIQLGSRFSFGHDEHVSKG